MKNRIAWISAACALLVCAELAGCSARAQDTATSWRLSPDSESVVTDAKLRGQIFHALDAAEHGVAQLAIGDLQNGLESLSRAQRVVDEIGHAPSRAFLL